MERREKPFKKPWGVKALTSKTLGKRLKRLGGLRSRGHLITVPGLHQLGSVSQL